MSDVFARKFRLAWVNHIEVTTRVMKYILQTVSPNHTTAGQCDFGYFVEGNLFTFDVGNLSDFRPFFSFEGYVFFKLLRSASSHFRPGFGELFAHFRQF